MGNRDGRDRFPLEYKYFTYKVDVDDNDDDDGTLRASIHPPYKNS